MDQATRKAYIRLRLEKVQANLTAAQDNLALGHVQTVVNRAYYAIFHITSAALLWLQVERVKHAGIHASLGEYLIKPGFIEPEYGKIFTRVRREREKQDYDLEANPPSLSDTTQLLKDAKRFVARLERFLHEQGAI